ncbi:MAG: RsmB/NOP family class I SAM-dependent RNA methyltransferase [Simkaniaceae bacterium]|nr:RsmB/NOP family class I SAM-dependent RNA methyltransferase [Simkaniaceae bacterium]
MNPFRKHHALAILNEYALEKGPLDLFLMQYFKNHRAIGSKDRKEIFSTIYHLYRHLSLIDYRIDDRPITWEKRLEALSSETLSSESTPAHIKASFPKELFQLLEKGYGTQKASDICSVLNEQAPITLRANLLKTNREDLIQALSKSMPLSPCLYSKAGIHLKERALLFSLKEFKQGLFEVQDEASQLAAELAAVQPGEHVLDYCAGAGGKTLAMAPNMKGKGQLYLYDVRKEALAQAKKRLKRAGIQNAQIIPPQSKRLNSLKGNMDCVFVDAPCSGTGTLRRNPEQKWKFSSQMLQELMTKQQDIFEEALKFLKPKGRIIYATCSILKEENEQQAAFFMEKYGLKTIATPFQVLPKSDKMDGFYAIAFSYK